MADEPTPLQFQIIAGCLIVATIIPIVIIRKNIKLIKQGRPETRFDNASIKTYFSIAGFIYPIYHFVNWLYTQNTSSKCRRCNWNTVTYTNVCIRCKVDNSTNTSVGASYKCNFCLNTFTSYSEYCPKCGKNDYGKYKGGAS